MRLLAWLTLVALQLVRRSTPTPAQPRRTAPPREPLATWLARQNAAAPRAESTWEGALPLP